MDSEQEMMEKQMAMHNAFQFGQKDYLSPMQANQNSILILTNPENELFKLECTLKNVRIDVKGNPIQFNEPLMNELGVGSVLGQVQAIVSQITIMSNFEEKHIMALINFLGDTLARDLMMSQEKYAIKNSYDRDKIYFESLTCAFVTMMRAFEQGEKKFWKGSQQEITTRIEGGKPANKGFFNNVLRGSFK